MLCAPSNTLYANVLAYAVELFSSTLSIPKLPLFNVTYGLTKTLPLTTSFE